MPILSNAQNFTINNSHFTDINPVSGPSGIDTLYKASCPEAAHDAGDREYSPRCFPRTREQYVQDTVHWAIPALGDSPTPIYWMKGPAGVGKSAIAQTCAEELKDRGYLGAAFFFSIARRNKPEKLFPSIAYQLSTIYPPYRDFLDERIRRDRSLVKKSMSFQFRYLIDEPLRELRAQGKVKGRRIAVIVDGLDECDGADAQCEIIRIIASAASDDASLPLCWALFSRPEPHIEAVFTETAVALRCHKAILPISRDADGEIELYLWNSFENIAKRRNPSTESRWPSAEDMRLLVDAADGSFIYATTVIRFVNQIGSLEPQRRLRAIIGIILERRKYHPCASGSIDTPFARLDAFYTLILKRIPAEIFPSVYLLLALICRLGHFSTILGANLLGLSKDEFEAVCHHASAVVQLQGLGKGLDPDPTIDPRCTFMQVNRGALGELQKQVFYNLGGRVTFYHKSFNDFLLDPTRSGSYCIKNSEPLANHCLKMHLYYDQTYCWEGSKLILPPDVTDSGSSLSCPYTNESVNSLTKAWVYIVVGLEDPESFSAPGGFGMSDASCDFRKHLHTTTHLWSHINSHPCEVLLWGCKCRRIVYPGASIHWISLAEFDINEFKSMTKRRKQANVIRHYYPRWSSRLKYLFCNKTQKHFESVIYRVGHDEKSIFWYWEIDYELGHYRDFWTTDFAEGEKIFREEDFDAPELGGSGMVS